MAIIYPNLVFALVFTLFPFLERINGIFCRNYLLTMQGAGGERGGWAHIDEEDSVIFIFINNIIL